MTKKHTNLSLDIDLVEKAKLEGWSLSEVAENAIKEKLGQKQVEMDISISECEFCGRELPKANADNPNKGLTWLWPDEKWICNKCLKKESLQKVYG